MLPMVIARLLRVFDPGLPRKVWLLQLGVLINFLGNGMVAPFLVGPTDCGAARSHGDDADEYGVLPGSLPPQHRPLRTQLRRAEGVLVPDRPGRRRGVRGPAGPQRRIGPGEAPRSGGDRVSWRPRRVLRSAEGVRGQAS